MNVGFSVISRNQQIQFTFPEEGTAGRSLVAFYRTGDMAAVVMGRLYYQQELVAKLQGRVAAAVLGAAASNDAALVLAAYEGLGQDGLPGLEGDSSLVLWDGRRDLLLAIRDPLGGYPLYWINQPGTMALSTSLRPLLDLLPQRSLDLEYMADFLMLPTAFYHELPGERCPYAGIARLAAGHLLRGHLQSGRIETLRSWDWLDHAGGAGPTSLEEAGEGLANLLRQAVRERMRGRTASHLSGGMDSTAVALLARECVGAGQAEGPLHALSLVYNDLTGLARETPYLDSVLDDPRGMVTHRIQADQVLDFDSFQDAPAHDEPWPWLYQLPIWRRLFGAAADAGATTVLTGIGADDLLQAEPYHITSLLRRGRWWAAWREASRWAQARTSSIWSILGPYGFANVLPAWCRIGLGPLLRRGYAPWVNQNEYTIAPWIRPEFARRYGMRGRALRHVRQTLSYCKDPATSAVLAILPPRTGDLSRWHLAAHHGIVETHPFLDPRIVKYCLSLPAAIKAQPDRSKPVLAEAMRGVLPDKIRQRFRKGHFNEVYYSGLSRNLPHLEALVEQAPIDDLGLFDKEVLLQCLQQTALGIGKNLNATDRLNITLALLKWLSQEEQWQRQPSGQWSVVSGQAEDPRLLCTSRLPLPTHH
jgi:asparagine synthase (glutamine-hydrolysing)